MKYFIDSEFHENGVTIDFVSIGICAEDGRSYYAISSEFDIDALKANPWLLENVWPHIRDDVENGNTKPKKQIAREIIEFCNISHDVRAEYSGTIPYVIQGPEFWAHYGAYDWIVMCQIHGRMIDLPNGWPMFCMDLEQYKKQLGVLSVPTHTIGDKHNALADAEQLKLDWEYLHHVEKKLKK